MLGNFVFAHDIFRFASTQLKTHRSYHKIKLQSAGKAQPPYGCPFTTLF